MYSNPGRNLLNGLNVQFLYKTLMGPLWFRLVYCRFEIVATLCWFMLNQKLSNVEDDN